MSVKKLLLFLLLGFGLFFLVQQPNEAARLVQITGENASELFTEAGEAFVKFMKSLI